MKGYKPVKPDGDTPFALFVKWIWDLLANGKFPIRGVGGIKVQYTEGYYQISGGGGSQAGVSGWMWVDGKKLYGDPTVNSYKKNQVVKILESDSIVTTGIVCLGSFSATKAVAGKWVCLQDVPVLLNDGTDDPAYIPTVPADSGSLDPDNTGNYWEFITPSSICAGGSTVTI